MTIAFALVSALIVGACTPEHPVAQAPPAGATERVLAGALRGRTGATLLIADAASRVEIRVAEMPGLLYRIATPADSALSPRISRRRGLHRLDFVETGRSGPSTVRIVLNRAVAWDLRIPVGAGEQQLDLSDGRVTRLDLGAAGLIELRLPPPTGTVPVILRNGAGTLELTSPRAVAMRLTLHSGARAVRTPWRDTLVSPTWPTARDRYAVNIRAETGTVTVHEDS